MYQEIHHTLKLADSNGQYEPKATAKLCTCNKCHKNSCDICFYVPFCAIFVCLGAIQIISGVFYFMKIPVSKLIFNVAIGCWGILCGISGSMVACACPSTPRKHEFLLYCSLSVLILNVINLVLLEIGQVREIFSEHLQKVLSKEYSLLESEHGRFITTYSAILLILIAFIEAQINFCFLSRSQTKYKKEKYSRKSRRPQQFIDNDQTADLEYVIPKKAETNGSRKPSMDTTVQVYAKSWVFEGTGVEAYHQPGDSCSASICSSSSPTNNIISNHKNQSHKKGHSSKLSDANSERFPQAAMSSFSRCATPSPIPYSGQATPTNIIYADYLGANQDHHRAAHKSTRLTVDYVKSVDVSIAPDATVVTPKLVAKPKAPKLAAANKSNVSGSNQSSISHQEDSQYASMLAELEQSLIEKKIQATNNMSPDDTSISTDKFGSSKSSSKDLEFSKELEAALQLIQDLETPSEGPADVDGQAAMTARVARSESEKTLSAAVSLPSPEQGPYKMQSPEAQTPQNGKHDDIRSSTNVIHIEPNSQSTSGYSSPSSYTSNVRLSNASNSVCGNSMSTTTLTKTTTDDQSYVVRIYIEQNSPSSTPAFNTLSKINPKSKDCTKSTGDSSIITANNNNNSNNKQKKSHRHHHQQQQQQQQQPSSNDAMNKFHPLFKKRPKAMLDSDFQNLIFKSECLAYLTDEELVARHKCNRDVIRKIEQNVAQKIKGSPRYSECSNN